MSSKKVLITGVSGYWGNRVAERMGELLRQSPQDQADLYILGLDSNAPRKEINGIDFIQADVRNPLIVNLLREEQVHTVCHLVFQDSVQPSEQSFEINVIGTTKLLGACAEAGVRKVVLMSSTAVYGAQPTNPAFLVEEHPLRGSRNYGYTRDLIEIELLCNSFRRQVPEIIQTVLRFPSIIGFPADTPMTRFLREPLAPVLLGFDPMMQVIHEHDVIESLVYALLNDIPGAYNIAAEGIIPLSKLCALAGKFAIPWIHPLVIWGSMLIRGSRVKSNQYFPFDLDYLRYSWVADTTKMRTEFGFIPQYTAEETLREFAEKERVRRYIPESATFKDDEEHLRETLEQRRRSRIMHQASDDPREEVEDDNG